MTTDGGPSVPERMVTILDDHIGAVRDTLERMTEKLHEVIDEVRPPAPTGDKGPDQEEQQL